MTSENLKSPFLEGNFAPYRQEDNIENLEVTGKIPNDLNGVLLRNGPNPQFDPVGRYHWFEGDGMLHAIRLHDGKASYDNRWVKTERFKLEKEVQKPLFNAGFNGEDVDPRIQEASHNTANTNIISYQNTLLALNEGAEPMSIDLKNLDTLGDYSFDGQVKARLSAHPRYDHKRKELITYSYITEDGFLHYYRFNSDNKLIADAKINWPYPAMMHDFINTENYVIFPVFPCTMSFERMMRGKSIFMWEPEDNNTWFVITNRDGKEITRIETDPCYVYHFGNAFEDGNDIIIDAMVSKKTSLMPDRNGKVATREDSNARLARWTISLKNSTIELEQIGQQAGEFPRFDERFNGYPYQHLYMGERQNAADLFDRITHYDLSNKTRKEHHFDGDVPWEPVFVPHSEKEGDGYLLTVVYRTSEDRSDLVILDANDISKEPIAVIKIPHRIPFGFHGNFVSDL